MSKWETIAQNAILDSIELKQCVLEKNISEIVNIASMIAQTIKNNGKLLICGNGGSLADAQHLAAELLVRLRPNINRNPLPAICLASDMSTVTACGNDFSFNQIFARTLEALGKSEDILLAISTSGNSDNVIQAAIKAKEMGIKVLAFIGGNGGKLIHHAELCFVVPSQNTARIQEMHITAGHIVMEIVEDKLLESMYIDKK